MNNLNQVFEKNGEGIKNFKIRKIQKFKGRPFYVIQLFEKELNGKCISKIIKYLNYYIKNNSKTKMPVLLYFSSKDIHINDKLTYVILECLCYYIISEYNVELHIMWKPQINIITAGLNSSLLLLLNSPEKENVEKFKCKFRNDGFGSHFRRLVENSNEKLCAAFQDVDTFFKMFNSCDIVKDDIVEVVAELVGNALEHGGSDCLIDIDVADNYCAQIDGIEQDVYSVNIVVINFSDKLIGDELRNKVYKQKCDCSENRYEKLRKAYKYHKDNFWNDKYHKEDFFNLAVFQDCISGVDKGKTGGKGLTVLIESLQRRSFDNHCYMLSGKRTVNFYKECLVYDDDNWLGFNEECNFFTCPPDNRVIDCCDTFFPGTAYNLDFILTKGD
ncbi:hypothetical protein SAMN02910358_01828 [Lachnospiraceae bacterium XBB1006]|nr:hypothetical protein SAMN02910358_01828 [Lachnospiraceae bacterium XBB1006]